MGLCVWPWGSPLLSCLRAKTPLYRSCNGLLWRVEHLERLSHYARRSSTIRNWLSGRPRPLLHLVSHNACFFISSWNLHPLFYYLPLYFKSPFLKINGVSVFVFFYLRFLITIKFYCDWSRRSCTLWRYRFSYLCNVWENLIELEWFYLALLGHSLSLKEIVQGINYTLEKITNVGTYTLSRLKD